MLHDIFLWFDIVYLFDFILPEKVVLEYSKIFCYQLFFSI